MNQTLGDYLRAARTKAGLSVRQLGTLSGMSHGYLVKLELGQQERPSAEHLMRLAEVLELDAVELLRFIGVEPTRVLPSAQVYFRRKYGLSDAEAEDLSRVVEDYRSRTLEEGRHGKNNTEDGDTERSTDAA
ncbi:helix-turn-helix domain-containing protein [Amycolatopsis sp. cmx-4-68]|uniref:helix-turn-helix domain-containing protein n=1 Tax=Amycolatopsis sp. cmx-4-68 TaxID=2790938 RepID=UPI00397B06C9